MAVQSVLALPELLSHIFRFFDKRSNGVNMQVCKAWAEIGKPIFWEVLESQADLKGLLRKLAPWTFTRPFRVPAHVDWALFLQFASLVRSVRIEMDADIASVFTFIAYNRPTLDLMPNLETLTSVVREPMQYDLQQSSLLLHPGLRHWVIDLTSSESPAELVTTGIPCFRLSGLLHLEIKVGRLDAFDLHPALLPFQKLQRLSTISIPRYTAKLNALHVLSRLPSLREIKTGFHSGPDFLECSGNHDQPPLLAFEDGAFPQLTHLVIAGCSHQLYQIVNDANFPVNIQALVIHRLKCGSDSISASLNRLVEKCHRIKNFTFYDVLEGVHSLYTDVELFLPYNLTKLKIQSYNPLKYNANQIESLAASLPSVEHLHLNCVRLSRINDFGTFKLNQLVLFARHCPKLMTLSILVDTSQPSALDTTQFLVLQDLDFGTSVLSPHLVYDAAKFLATLLPRHCDVHNYASTETWEALYKILSDLRKIMDLAGKRERAKLLWR